MGTSHLLSLPQWVIQSHLSTEVYSDAMNGLRRTRRYRSLTLPFRRLNRKIEHITYSLIGDVVRLFGFSLRQQQSLLWARDPPIESATETSDEEQARRLRSPRQSDSPILSQPTQAAIPLSPIRDSPFQSTSRFPQPVSLRRHRESDASAHVPLIPTFRNESVFQDSSRSSHESPAFAPDDRGGYLSPTLQRHAYHRQGSSDASSMSHSRPGSGLGIHMEEN